MKRKFGEVGGDGGEISTPRETKKAKVESEPMATLLVPRKPATRVVKIQRRDGKVIQDCDVYIGRAVARGGWQLPGSKWANPFSIAKYGSAEKVVQLYEEYLVSKPDLMASLPELQGKVLGCWCKPGPCHGDVLVKMANKLAFID